jgi:hypothetical protein
MGLSAITRVGEVKSGSIPQMGPARGKSLIVEIGTASTPAGSFEEIEIGQDAAVDLVEKLTTLLKARGCL